MTDTRLQELTGIDEQILELVDKRASVWGELEEAGYEFSGSDMAQLVSNWLEIAADYELDEELVEKAAKIINGLCRRNED